MKTKRLIYVNSSEGLKSELPLHHCTNVCPIVKPEQTVLVLPVTLQPEASLYNNEVSSFLMLIANTATVV